MYGTEEAVQDKVELVRIHWPTVRRIVMLLHTNGMMKKSMIAMRCNLRYDRFKQHLDWCKCMKLVRFRADDGGSELIALTDRGIELYREQFVHRQLD